MRKNSYQHRNGLRIDYVDRGGINVGIFVIFVLLFIAFYIVCAAMLSGKISQEEEQRAGDREFK